MIQKQLSDVGQITLLCADKQRLDRLPVGDSNPEG